jgi:hypothetical protein
MQMFIKLLVKRTFYFFTVGFAFAFVAVFAFGFAFAFGAAFPIVLREGLACEASISLHSSNVNFSASVP